MTALSGVTYLAMNNTESKNLRTADPIKSAWDEWVVKFGKSYPEAELPLKYSTFTSNYKYV
jgi:hypothetical protein